MAKAIEFRNESWYIAETTELLNEHNATMVLYDFFKAKLFTWSGRANFAYMRFMDPLAIT